jgi:cytochrome c-type biogenesis protein CcmE
MNRNQKRRAWLISGIIVAAIGVIFLALIALRNNIDLYYTPSELNAVETTPRQTIRVGGWVAKHSVHYEKHQQIEFVLTDHKGDVLVRYIGLLPSLFREEQGIVVVGHRLVSGEVKADQVLAKHDENYHPPKLVEDQIRKQA